MSDATCIDLTALSALEDLGDKGFVVQMIDIFLGHAPKLIAEARQALSNGDLVPVIRMGHTLHSSARNLGVVKMKEVAARIEAAAREKQVTLLPSLFAEMDRVFAEGKECLEQEKTRLQA